MNERERAARAIGFLEGFGAWIWDNVGGHLADEFADCYDRRVDELRRALFEGADEEGGNEE